MTINKYWDQPRKQNGRFAKRNYAVWLMLFGFLFLGALIWFQQIQLDTMRRENNELHENMYALSEKTIDTFKTIVENRIKSNLEDNNKVQQLVAAALGENVLEADVVKQAFDILKGRR
jgi:hypothetical protein